MSGTFIFKAGDRTIHNEDHHNVPDNEYALLKGYAEKAGVVICPKSLCDPSHGTFWIQKRGDFWGVTTRDCPKCLEMQGKKKSKHSGTDENNLDTKLKEIADQDEALYKEKTDQRRILSNQNKSGTVVNASSTVSNNKLDQQSPPRRASYLLPELRANLGFIPNLTRNIFNEMEENEKTETSTNNNSDAAGDNINVDRLISDLYDVVGTSVEKSLAFEKLNPSKKYKVAVIGTTGAGKSTLIGSLLGYGLEFKGSSRYLCYSNSREHDFSETEAKTVGQPVLGTDGACTLGTQIYARTNTQGQLAFVDCGGFLDTRSANFDICNAATLKCIDPIYAIVVVISSAIILENHSTHFTDLVYTLRNCFSNSFDAWKSVLFVVNDKQPVIDPSTDRVLSEIEVHDLIYDTINDVLKRTKAQIDKLLGRFGLTYEQIKNNNNGKSQSLYSKYDPTNYGISQIIPKDQIEDYQNIMRDIRTWEKILSTMTDEDGVPNHQKSNVVVVRLKNQTPTTRSATRERIISIIHNNKINDVAVPAFTKNFDAVCLFDSRVADINNKLKIVCNVSVRYINRWFTLTEKIKVCLHDISLQLVATKANIDQSIMILNSEIAVRQHEIDMCDSDSPVKLPPIRNLHMSRRVLFFGYWFTNPAKIEYNNSCCPYKYIEHYVNGELFNDITKDKQPITGGYFVTEKDCPQKGHYMCKYTPGYYSEHVINKDIHSQERSDLPRKYFDIDTTAEIVPVVAMRHSSDYINKRLIADEALYMPRSGLFSQLEFQLKRQAVYQLYATGTSVFEDEISAKIVKDELSEINRVELDGYMKTLSEQFGYFEAHKQEVLKFSKAIAHLINAFRFQDLEVNAKEYMMFLQFASQDEV